MASAGDNSDTIMWGEHQEEQEINDTTKPPKLPEKEESDEEDKIFNEEDDRARGATRRAWVTDQCQVSCDSLALTVKTEEKELQLLMSHGCSLIGNIEVASVTSNVESQAESEASEDFWRKAFEESSRDAEQKISSIESQWKEAEKLTVAEDVHEQLLELKAQCDEVMSKKKSVTAVLRKQVTDLEGQLCSDIVNLRAKREELVRRLTEHANELHSAMWDTIAKMRLKSEEEHSALVGKYSEELECAVAEFSSELQQVLQEAVEGLQERSRQATEERIHSKTEEKTELNLQKLELEWQKSKLSAAALSVNRALEKPRLLYRLRMLRHQLRVTTANLSAARRKLNTLRPKRRLHRIEKAAANEAFAASRCAKLHQVRQEAEGLRLLQERMRGRRQFLRNTCKQLSAMHREHILQLISELQQIEQTISVTVLGQDSVPPAVDSTAFQALWCSPGKEGGAMWAAERIFSAPAGPGDINSLLTHDERDEEDQLFLLGVADAASFLIDISKLPKDAGSTAMVRLEHIFKELDISSEDDVKDLLSTAKKCTRDTSTLAIKHESFNSEESSESSEESHLTPRSTDEVLEILCLFVKQRNERRHREDRPQERSDASTALTTPADEMRWQDFVEQLTRNRTRTWAIARDVVDQYHATLRGRREDEIRIHELELQVRDLRLLLSGEALDGQGNNNH